MSLNLYSRIFPQDVLGKRMNLNPISLSFTGEQGHLEEQFLKDYFQKYLLLFRVCHFFSIFFFGIFAVVDSLVFYEQIESLLFICFGIVIPVFLLGFVFTFHSLYEKFWPVINNFYVILTGAGFLVMIMICPSPLNSSYYVGVFICIVFGYTFIRSRFLMASIAGAILLVIYVLVAQLTAISNELFLVQFAFLF